MLFNCLKFFIISDRFKLIWIYSKLYRINKAIYKTRNTGTGNRMRGMRGTREMFTRILGNLLEDSGECYCFNIPGNVRRDSGECSKRFRGMLKKIPGNVREDPREYSRRFRGMLKKISGNLNLYLFCEILLIFYQILQSKCEKTKEYFLRY